MIDEPVRDVTKSETGQRISELAQDTVKRFHEIVADSKEINESTSSAIGFMANSTMVFVQLIEFMTNYYKVIMATAYGRAGNENDSRNRN